MNNLTKWLNLSKDGFYLLGLLFHPFITFIGFKVSRYPDEMGREGQGREVFTNASFRLLPRLTSEAGFPRACLESVEKVASRGQFWGTLTDFRSGMSSGALCAPDTGKGCWLSN